MPTFFDWIAGILTSAIIGAGLALIYMVTIGDPYVLALLNMG